MQERGALFFLPNKLRYKIFLTKDFIAKKFELCDFIIIDTDKNNPILF